MRPYPFLRMHCTMFKKILALGTLLVSAHAMAQDFGQCLQHFPQKQVPKMVNASVTGIPLCFEAFAVYHSKVFKTPIWVVEKLTPESLDLADAVKREDAFHAESQLPATYRAELADYKQRRPYDQGHMANAADMPTVNAQWESFSLANMVPQHASLNRIKWRQLEARIRKFTYAVNGPVYVYTGPYYQKIIGELNSRVQIPSHFWKLVFDATNNKAFGYIAENNGERAPIAEMDYKKLSSTIGIKLIPLCEKTGC